MTKNKTKKTVEPVEKKNVCQDGEVLEERLEEELITLSRNEYEEMQARINEACKKAEDHLDGWHRERAVFFQLQEAVGARSGADAPDDHRRGVEEIPGYFG